MKYLLIGAATAAAVTAFATAALADPAPAAPAAPAGYPIETQGVIGGDYTYIDAGSSHANEYGGEAAAITPFGTDFSGQINGSYHSIDPTSGSGNFSDWNIAGTGSWDKPWGRLGVNVGYADVDGFGSDLSATNYGAYGEYYATDAVTVGVRAGGVSLNGGGFGGSGNQTGGYVGGELVGYLMPDLDLQGHVDYTGINSGNQTRAGVEAEWLFSESTPLSGFVGYDYTNLSGGGANVNANAFTVGLRFYLGGSGTLVQHHRSGVDGFGDETVDIVR